LAPPWADADVQTKQEIRRRDLREDRGKVKFITDGMLGKLTRWLRMLGHDVEYAKDLDDKTLIGAAVAEQRVLLTRDVELHRRAAAQGVTVILVEGADEAERLAALANLFNLRLELDPEVSRCPKCNARLVPVGKDQIADRIPPSTKVYYEDFWMCVECMNIYWKGSHWKKIVERLEEAKKMAAERRQISFHG
jgi:uncharacterized protein with PIN domain